MIYDLLILEMVTLNTSQNYLMIYLKDITNIGIGQKFKFLWKLIGCEAQERAE